MSTISAHEAKLLRHAARWRRTLEKSIRRHRHLRTKSAAGKCALGIVEGLVFLKLAQQRKLEPADALSKLLTAADPVRALEEAFSHAGNKYHSTVFGMPKLSKYPGVALALVKVLCAAGRFRMGKIPVSILGKIYESDPGGTRNGVFFTPDFISDYLVRQTLEPYLVRKQRPALIDPACGAGAFPLKAFEQILAAGKTHKSLKQKLRILRACIHGVDIDSYGVELAKLSLLLKLYEDTPTAANAPIPNLSANIRTGNALVSKRVQGANPFSWPEAFPSVAKAGGFDAAIVNPPYVNIRELTRKHGPEQQKYFARQYVCAEGAYDLFVLFAEKSLQLLRPNGRLGIIVPNKLATRKYAKPCREMLLSETKIESIADISPMCVFSRTGVYPYIIFGEKTPPPKEHLVRIVEVYSRADLKPGAAALLQPQSSLSAEEGLWIHHE